MKPHSPKQEHSAFFGDGIDREVLIGCICLSRFWSDFGFNAGKDHNKTWQLAGLSFPNSALWRILSFECCIFAPTFWQIYDLYRNIKTSCTLFAFVSLLLSTKRM